jgi:flagellar motor switch protein FliN/FliY
MDQPVNPLTRGFEAVGDQPRGATDTSTGAARVPPPGGLDLLKDVPLRVTVELGRTRMSVRDVLALRVGSIIELDRLSGAPVDVLVNGVLIARGEVVVIDERFGVRITEVVTAGSIGSSAG